MKRVHVVALVSLAGAVALLTALSLALDWRRAFEPTPAPVKLRFACSKFLGELLPMVALDKGFFKDEGLQIEIHCSTTGSESLKRLLNGQADVATVAQLPLVYAALDRKKYTDQPAGDFAIVADLTVANRAQAILVRRDRGISAPADLRGKRIALPQGTTADFFLDSVLSAQGIGYPEVTLINTDVTKAPDLLIAGEVDAILSWQPHTARARAAMGDKVATLAVGYLYPNSWLVVFMKDYLRAQPGVAERFLRALVRAESFALAHPEESQAILARQLQMDLSLVSEGMKDFSAKVWLSEALMSTLDAQARWAMRRGLAPTQPLPNFLHYLDPGPLQRVKPGSISLAE